MRANHYLFLFLRNLLIAPSALDPYSPSTFAGIYDTYHAMREAGDEESRFRHRRELEKQVSLLTLAVECATNTLSFSSW